MLLGAEAFRMLASRLLWPDPMVLQHVPEMLRMSQQLFRPSQILFGKDKNSRSSEWLRYLTKEPFAPWWDAMKPPIYRLSFLRPIELSSFPRAFDVLRQ